MKAVVWSDSSLEETIHPAEKWRHDGPRYLEWWRFRQEEENGVVDFWKREESVNLRDRDEKDAAYLSEMDING